MRRMKSQNIIYEGSLLEMYTEYGDSIVLIGGSKFDYLEFEIYDFATDSISQTYYRISKEALNMDSLELDWKSFFNTGLVRVFQETGSDELVISNEENDNATVYFRIVGVK